MRRGIRVYRFSPLKRVLLFFPLLWIGRNGFKCSPPRFFERTRTKDSRRNYYYVTSHFSIFPSHEILKREDCATITANGTSNRKRCVLIGTSFFREGGERKEKERKKITSSALKRAGETIKRTNYTADFFSRRIEQRRLEIALPVEGID